MDQMLGHQGVPFFPPVDADFAEPAHDTDLPPVRTDLLLGQEETRRSTVARGKHPRTLNDCRRFSSVFWLWCRAPWDGGRTGAGPSPFGTSVLHLCDNFSIIASLSSNIRKIWIHTCTHAVPKPYDRKKIKHFIGRKIVNDVYLDVKNQRSQNVITPRTNTPVKVCGTTKPFWPQKCL